MNSVLEVAFPNDPFTASRQQREQYVGSPDYRNAVHALWAALDDDPRPSALMRGGFDYLVRKYYQIQAWSLLKGHPTMSSEFRDLKYFAAYVGPRPSPHLHLDRLNPHLGYVLDNVHWANNEVKASNKRKTRFHRYLDRSLTDEDLSRLLKSKGVAYSADTLKHFRQYWTDKGLLREEITRRIFQKHSLPYDSSTDPVENADFPDRYQLMLSRAYQFHKHLRESRVEFSIRWLCLKADEAASIAKTVPESTFHRMDLLNLERDLRQTVTCLKQSLSDLQYRKAGLFLAEFQPHPKCEAHSDGPLTISAAPDVLPPPDPAEEIASKEEVAAYLRELMEMTQN